MNRSTPLRRTPFKRGTSQLKRSEFVKKKRTDDMARAKAKVYRLKSKPESAEDKAWKKAVRERDGYRCRWPDCDVESKSIHAHHIHTRKQRPDLRYDINNGAALCFTHHDRLHHTVEGRRRGRELGLLGTETYEKAMKSKAA